MHTSNNIKARYGLMAVHELNVFPERLSAGSDHDDFLMVLEKILENSEKINACSNKLARPFEAQDENRPFYSILQMSIPLIQQIDYRLYKLAAGFLVWNGLIFRGGSLFIFDALTGKLVNEIKETASVVNAIFKEMEYDVYNNDSNDYRSIPEEVIDELGLQVDYTNFDPKVHKDEMYDLIKYISIYAPELYKAKDANTYVACHIAKEGETSLLEYFISERTCASYQDFETFGDTGDYDKCFIEFNRKDQPFAYAPIECLIGPAFKHAKKLEREVNGGFKDLDYEDTYGRDFNDEWIKAIANSEEEAGEDSYRKCWAKENSYHKCRKYTLNGYLKVYKRIIELKGEISAV
jgi:hypothetical protein